VVTESNRVAIVTGCGKRIGIGSQIARRLSAGGMTVVVTDLVPAGVRNEAEKPEDLDASWGGIESLVAELRAEGAHALATIGDVSVWGDVERMVAEAMSSFGRIDVLVNNASAPQGPDYDLIEQVPVDAFNRVLSVNLGGTFLMSRAVVPLMRSNGWGRIINMASTAALGGTARLGAYSASKAAIVGLTRCLALEVGTSGITVNAICPGQIMTSRTLNNFRRKGVSDVAAAYADQESTNPVGRNGRPDDIASLAVFLASDEASFITGQEISVDGGRSMALTKAGPG
jgi:3-oxoacyl-[acyl-carrier protein] reductase